MHFFKKLLFLFDDYRQWLISVARYAFKLMKDQGSLNELPAIDEENIESMDTMLAWANELRSLNMQ